MIICLALFLIGFIEEFIGIIYYGFIRKGWKLPCAITAMLRNVVWLIVSAGIFASFLDFSKPLTDNLFIAVLRGLSHTVGVGLGDFVSLVCEPYIDKVILKLKNKGRKKKRWYIQREANIKQ
jgi:hypothetical protein